MNGLTSSAGIVALAAAVIAAIALLLALALALRLRRVRADQRVVLGEDRRDLAEHAAELQAGFEELRRFVQGAARELEARAAYLEARVDRTLAYRALLRYDAYGEMSGRQSTSLALLDATRSGVVLSSIHHRDQARVYAKQVFRGEAELQLSPEEEEAVQAALAGVEPAGDGSGPRGLGRPGRGAGN